MVEIILRGRILSFCKEPEFENDDSAYHYIEDGALHIKDGVIIARGLAGDILENTKSGIKTIDHRPHLIMPGFIDTHVHFPQTHVIASYAGSLLEWLNKYTFIEEQKFGDEKHAKRMAKVFIDELLRNGTTTAVAYCSVHKTSVDAFFEEAHSRNALMIAGKVMMDRNAPEGLLDTPQSSYDDTSELIGKWHNNGRAKYAITPRFAITSSPEQLEMAGALVKKYPDCYMQTHLSENNKEIEFTAELYPKAKDYTDIYEHYGLLGEKSLFGHSIHLSEREINALSQTQSVAVFCPTSNLFLGSGLFDFDKLHLKNVRISLATDIGGGTSFSMLKTADEAYKIQQLNSNRLTPVYSFYQLTLGNARALKLENKIGTLEAGTDADIIALNSRATKLMDIRMETVTTLSEELFLLQTLGDDRAIAATYVAGKAVM